MPTTPEPTVAKPQADQWERFCKLIIEPKYEVEHKLLAVVKGLRKAATIKELKQALGIETDGGFGARIGNIAKIGKSAGLDRNDLIVRSGKTFRSGPSLAANELPPVPEPNGARRK